MYIPVLCLDSISIVYKLKLKLIAALSMQFVLHVEIGDESVIIRFIPTTARIA